MKSDMVELGFITKAHGIKGEVCVHYTADSLSLLSGTIYLQLPDKDPLPYSVLHARMHHDKALLLLAGVKDRNMAEALRKAALLVPASSLPPLDATELYLNDLRDLPVLLYQEGRTPLPLGSITDVQIIGESEVWAITTPEGKEILFPVADAFIHAVSEEAITIAPPQGLLELYL